MNITNLRVALEKILEDLECFEEHADPRGEIIARVRALTPNIVTHLYKIYGFYNKESIHHWVAEISADLRKFCHKKDKATKTALSTEEIMNIMIEKYMDSSELAEIEGELYKDYGFSKLDNDTLYNKIYGVLPELINYVKSIPTNERPQISKLEEIINGH